jgi:hypothetical protein
MDGVCDALDQAVKDLRRHLDTCTDAEVDYKLDNYRIYREAGGTVDDRKAEAFLATAVRYRVWKKAENLVKVQWAHLGALKERLGKLRTEEATERELSGTGRHP